MLRLGLIGAGRWGRNYIKTIAAVPGVRLAMLASRNPQSAALVPAGCTLTHEWRDLLGPGGVDALIVATPPAMHAEMVHAAVARSLPVLAEKPLTMNLREATALRDFVAAQAGFVMVDHTHLYSPAYRELKRSALRCGAITAIASRAGNMGPFRGDAPVLWDWGAHDVALCLDLLGVGPDTVNASLIDSRATPEGLGEVVEIHAAFPGAVPAVLTFGNILAKTRRLTVHLERATLIYDDLAADKLVRYPPCEPFTQPRAPGEPIFTEPRLPLACAVAEFAAAVEAGSRSMRDLDLSVEVVRVLADCEPQPAR